MQLLKAAGVVGRRERYEHQAIYDYRYVLHDVQLNAWVIAWKRLLGELLLDWSGETAIEPPQGLRVERPLRLDVTDWSAEDLRDPRPRLLRPDAILEVVRKDGEGSRTFLIEYDRTGRPDKNLEKLRRYDAFLTWWWRHSVYRDVGPPFVIFVCQNGEQRDLFLDAADHELTGHHWHPSRPPEEYGYVGRSRVLFSVDRDIHSEDRRAARTSRFPPDHRARRPETGVRPIRLPG